MTLAEAIDVLLAAHPQDEPVPADLSAVSASDYAGAWRVLRRDQMRRQSTTTGQVIGLIDTLKGLVEGRE